MSSKADISDCKITIGYYPQRNILAILGYKGQFAGSAGLTYQREMAYFEDLLLKKPDQNDHFFFNRLLIFRAFRNRGLGGILLDNILQKANDTKISIINSVNAYGELSKEDTILFYKRHGFEELPSGVLLYRPH